MSDEVNMKVLKWFGHMEHISGDLSPKRVYESEVEGRRVGGRPCTTWLDGVKKVSSAKSLQLTNAKVKYTDIDQRRDFVNGTNGEMSH